MIIKTFCSTLNSWIGELVFWCHDQVSFHQSKFTNISQFWEVKKENTSFIGLLTNKFLFLSFVNQNKYYLKYFVNFVKKNGENMWWADLVNSSQTLTRIKETTSTFSSLNRSLKLWHLAIKLAFLRSDFAKW